MDKPATFAFWFFALISPIAAVAIALSVLIMSNMILGMYAFYVKMETIESKKIRYVLLKLGFYVVALVVTYLLEKHLFIAMPLVKITAGFIAINELQSIASNYKTIYGISPLHACLNWFDRLLRRKSDKPTSKEI
jgi:hypothetical protein